MASEQRTSTCAVVVTHNRRELLAECLEAVLGQTRRPDRVLVVDNASTDGTDALVAERFPEASLLRMPENDGSAAGFGAGMTWAVDDAAGHEWIRLMDDDTVPSQTRPRAVAGRRGALADRDPMLLASKVLWTDGRLHPMNYSGPRFQRMDDFVAGVESGVVEMRYTTWVSLLARREAVKRYGVPRRNYFIWNDDIEWTARVLRRERGFLVPASVAVHRTETAEPSQGGRPLYYAVRNGLFMLRSRSALAWKEKVLHGLAIADQVRAYLVANRFRPRAGRGAGSAHGARRRPEQGRAGAAVAALCCCRSLDPRSLRGIAARAAGVLEPSQRAGSAARRRRPAPKAPDLPERHLAHVVPRPVGAGDHSTTLRSARGSRLHAGAQPSAACEPWTNPSSRRAACGARLAARLPAKVIAP